MEKWLKMPKAVCQARESGKGLHWAIEILIFIAVFFACAIAEVLVVTPLQLVFLLSDQRFLDAVASGSSVEFAVRVAETSLGENQDLYMIASLFSTGVMILLIILFCRLIQKRKLTSIGFVKKGFLKEYIKGIAAGAALFSAAVLICIVTGALKVEYVAGTFTLPLLLLFAAGYMVQGMAEEVLCRGYFMVSLGRRYSMTTAVLMNSVAFAALHLLNPGIAPLAIINLTLFGIFASVCFIKTENIWLIGALHSVWNLVQGNIYGIKVSGGTSQCTVLTSVMAEGKEFLNGGEFGLEGGLAVTVVLAAGTAFLLFYKNKNNLVVKES